MTTNLTSPLLLYTLLYYTVLTVSYEQSADLHHPRIFLRNSHSVLRCEDVYTMLWCMYVIVVRWRRMVYVCTYTIDCDMFSPQMRGCTYMNIVCTQCSTQCYTYVCTFYYVLRCKDQEQVLGQEYGGVPCGHCQCHHSKVSTE